MGMSRTTEKPTTTTRSPLLTTAELAAYLGVPRATLYAWSYRSEGPPTIKVGRHLRYRESDIEAWLQHQRRDLDGSAMLDPEVVVPPSSARPTQGSPALWDSARR